MKLFQNEIETMTNYSALYSEQITNSDTIQLSFYNGSFYRLSKFIVVIISNGTIITTDTNNFQSEHEYWNIIDQRIDNRILKNIMYEFTIDEHLYNLALNKKHHEFQEAKKNIFHHMLLIAGKVTKKIGTIKIPTFWTFSACSPPHAKSFMQEGYGVLIYNLIYDKVPCGSQICKKYEKYELITLLPWNIAGGKLNDILTSIEEKYQNNINAYRIFTIILLVIMMVLLVAISFGTYIYQKKLCMNCAI